MRLMGRLLAGAAALTALGVLSSIRLIWNQSSEMYGPDGVAVVGPVSLGQRLPRFVLDLTYGTHAVTLLVACFLFLVATVVLRRLSTWRRAGWPRWEVLGTGLVLAIPVVGLTLADLYVVTGAGRDESLANYTGLPPMPELALSSLFPLCACVVTLVVTGLWWRHADDVPSATDADEDAMNNDGPEGASELTEGPDANGPGDLVTRETVADVEMAKDYRHDWSPEDFRRPS